jgi:hypothetical protein
MKTHFWGIVSILFLVSCNQKNKVEQVERAFYYWKTSEEDLKSSEYNVLDSLKIKKLYVKFFEVEYNQTMGNIPVSKTNLNKYYWFDEDKIEINTIIVPTIFIKNDVFIKSSKTELDTLISNIHQLVKKYHKEKFKNFDRHLNEIQFDCDWTLKSKDNYFYFLEEFHKQTKIDLSCTLRLYPYKYRTKMGIPPVKKVTLMCYNLIQPFEDNTKNSILEISELESYLTVSKKYPLHLDIALPIFSWCHLYQYDEFRGFTGLKKDVLNKISNKKSDLWYEVKIDTSINDTYYRIGDKIKFEEANEQKINDAITLLKKNIDFDKQTTITLFHLDSNNLNVYDHETLAKFYSSFSN